MLLSLAWRNVWRSRKRSAIIIAAITFGLWGGLIADAVMIGWGDSMVSSAIDRDLGHVQIHKPGFTANHEINNYIPDAGKIMVTSRTIPGVAGVSGRTVVMAMAASPTSTFGVQINGIDPVQAQTVTNISSLIQEGSYLGADSRNGIVIGRKLASRLNLKLHSKVVLSFQALDSTMASAAFRIEGIYKSGATTFDESHVFVNRTDLNRLLGGELVIHEIAIRTTNTELMLPVLDKLQTDYPALATETWKQLAPEVAATSSATAQWSYVFVGIILFALTFGITNTMLMAVMERRREFGILIGVGMKRGRVFIMILLETVMLSLTGGVGGLLLGAGTIQILSHTGIDFSSFSASLESFGAGAILYPSLPPVMYLSLVVMLLVAALVGASFPAWKAVRLKPATAIRK